MSKGRVEAFSDGVFSIAITLLVLTIAQPEHWPVAGGWRPITGRALIVAGRRSVAWRGRPRLWRGPMSWGRGATGRWSRRWRFRCRARRAAWLAGYEGALSIEHEDALMSVDEGFQKCVDFLREVMPSDPPLTDAWWTR